MKCTSRRRPSRGIANVRIRIGLAGLCLALLSSCASMPLGLQKDGTYILEANEQSLDCDRLYKAIWGRVQNMKTMPAKAKAELDQAPPTAFLALGRIFGGQSKGLATIAEYDRESRPRRRLASHDDREELLGPPGSGAGARRNRIRRCRSCGRNEVAFRFSSAGRTLVARTSSRQA